MNYWYFRFLRYTFKLSVYLVDGRNQRLFSSIAGERLNHSYVLIGFKVFAPEMYHTIKPLHQTMNHDPMLSHRVY